jgi:hypothetical protein
VPDPFSMSPITQAMEDIRERSLAHFPCEVAKLLYLSSTRDYSTGRYHHEGLLLSHTMDTAEKALRYSHNQIFEALVIASLEDLVRDLQIFFSYTLADEARTLAFWKQLEPYRLAVPEESGTLSRELFFANIKTALAVVEGRLAQRPQSQQSALRPQ